MKLALDLRGKNLTYISSSIFKYTQLKILLMNSNRLTKLPSEIGELDKLIVLNLSVNHLNILPPEIGKLSQLRFLILNSYPPNYEPNFLTDITIDPLTYEVKGKLKESQNSLTLLPSEIGLLNNLVNLNLIGNPILIQEQEKIKKLLPNCTIQF